MVRRVGSAPQLREGAPLRNSGSRDNLASITLLNKRGRKWTHARMTHCAVGGHNIERARASISAFPE
eukprot:6783297-Alexandrium_andersonii.AAC.1